MSLPEPLERLFALARREAHPEPDVTSAVLSRLQHEADDVPAALPAAVVSLCAAAAVILALLGAQAWSDLASPWASCWLGASGGWFL